MMPNVRAGPLARPGPPEEGRLNCRTFLSMRQQDLPENNGIVVRLVVSRVNKCHRTFEGQVAQSIKFFAMHLDLRGISPAELLPTGGIMSEPFSQLRAWCQLLHPIIDCGIGLPHSTRPQPVNQDTLAVTVRRSLICAFQFEILLGDFPTHPHRSLLPTVKNIGRCDHACDDEITSGSRPEKRSPPLHATTPGEKR